MLIASAHRLETKGKTQEAGRTRRQRWLIHRQTPLHVRLCQKNGNGCECTHVDQLIRGSREVRGSKEP